MSEIINENNNKPSSLSAYDNTGAGPAGHQNDDSAFLGLIRQISSTRESRELLAEVVPALLDLWATSGSGAGATRKTARKGIAGLAGNSIKKSFLDEKGLKESPRLAALVADPDQARTASNRAGRSLDSLFNRLNETLEELDGLPAEQKRDLAATFIGDFFSGRGAPLITSVCRIINDIHKQDPVFLAKALEPGLAGFISRLDFGEVKEVLDSASEGVSALAVTLNQLLWKYPAKVVSLLSLLPPLLNATMEVLHQSVTTMNQKGSPDLVADLILAIFRETNVASLAGLINEVSELTRKFHTGSALIGEPGSPQLPQDVFSLLDSTFQSLDRQVLRKAALAMTAIKENAACSLTDALAAHPDLMADHIKNKSATYNSRLRTAHHRLNALQAFGQNEVNAALKEALSDFDAQEAADTLTEAAAMAGRVLESCPETVTEKTAAFADALDPYVLTELAESVSRFSGDALKPLGRALVPHLVKGVLTSLQPHEDEFEEAAESARNMLLSFLNAQETSSHE